MENNQISTQRLKIRRFNGADLTDLAAFIRDKMASEYAPYDTQWPTDDMNMKNILGYFMSDDAWYAVELSEIGKVIGFVCANHNVEVPNLGFTIHSDYQNNGYAYEACLALMQYYKNAFGIKKFVAGTADCNEPSVKLLLKLGFKKYRSVEESFAKDKDGNPIIFKGSAYECNYE
jgi:[ribosomal protein S5]-alanine N-acetyltransferase